MKNLYECPVESLTILDEEIAIEIEERIYTFIPNDQGYVSRVRIVCRDEDDAADTIYHSVIQDLQELESILSFTHSLKRIRYENLKHEFIFERPEERAGRMIMAAELGKREYRIQPKVILRDSLERALSAKAKLAPLIVPFAFYREAMRDHYEFRYINAFYNFYFILEGFYSAGKWRNVLVAQEFRASELAGFISWMINDHIKTKPNLLKRITDVINDMNRRRGGIRSYANRILDVDGVVDLIIDTRGSLHHYNPTLSVGTPFNQEYYMEIEFVLMGLALMSLHKKLGDLGFRVVEDVSL